MDQINTAHFSPLYFAAPVSWYSQLVALNTIYIANEQTFERQTLRNRLNYGTFQGPKMFSIPLIHSSTKENYQKVAVDFRENWQHQLINALQTSYGKSPFFEFYGYRFENIIHQGHEFLWDLNIAILKETLNCLKIPIPLEFIKIDRITNIIKSESLQYYQVFLEKIEFLPDLSILDLLYNEGPDAYHILLEINKNTEKNGQKI